MSKAQYEVFFMDEDRQFQDLKKLMEEEVQTKEEIKHTKSKSINFHGF